MTATLRIKLLDFWQISSGNSSGMDSDMLPVLNQSNCPYIPGRVIKGLFFDAFLLLRKSNTNIEDNATDIYDIFGAPNEANGKGTASSSYFGNANLPENVQLDLIQNKCLPLLFQKISSTALEGDTAKSKSLRKITYCIPMQLEASIQVNDQPSFEILDQCCGLIKSLGASRNRGFGRCTITLMNN